MDIARISACTYPLRERPWQEALEVVARAGYKKVDLLGRAPHLSLDPAECDPAVVATAAEALGLRVANLGTYVGRGFAAQEPAALEAELALTRRAIEVASLFGARSIRVVPGDDQPAGIDHIAPWFARAAEFAARAGVYMGFETHGGGISGSPARSRELADKVGSPWFGVLYDPSNVMGSGVDYRVALWEMREHIVHVHVKDGAVTMDKGYGRTMLGQGQVDYGWVLGALDRIGYTGDLALEYELPDPAPEVGLVAFLQAALAL